jgi:hypothetical protein
MSREQIIRDTAYAIWEAEGKPQGRDALHWKQAEERVAASTNGAVAGSKTPAKGKVSAAAPKPAPKSAAAKAAAKTKA